jgi:ubiquinone/menaquinone biosynthesis C-methylase UbiE
MSETGLDAHEEGLIPPTEMLHDGSSSSEQFILLGDNFCHQILVPRAGLHPSAAVLDMGCGNGSLARALTRVLDASAGGRYEGVDVNATTIAWLREHYKEFPNFRFTHANVFSTAYNAAGRGKAGAYRFPFPDASFDLVVMKSVFTHMLPGEIRNYLRETSRVLKPIGRSVITYFLLNEDSRALAELGKAAHDFKYRLDGDPSCLVIDPAVPESGAAHDEHRIRGYYREFGFHLLDIGFGSWCGRPTYLGHQDLIIAIKQA